VWLVSNNDRNAATIVSALRAAGAVVWYIESAANVAGLPDLLVGHRGKTYLLEVKTPRGRLSAQQQDFIQGWTGGPAVIVRSAEQALAAIGLNVEAGTAVPPMQSVK
jgi:hypothetical protein